VTGSISGGVLRNFEMVQPFCSHTACKVRPAHRADSSTVVVVPNVKERVEAQHSIPPVRLHDLLGVLLQQQL
jgi:hypothetical protein